ncbi:unnamed protein product [Dibothriocephalus latus]|uniref:Acetyl-CoA hydrolase/transferase N-terminal domain-containing protein n=1 Tax=Dibothriocephalus latus TaxID=60516 RepID=A0A3P7LT54_DIBLA|nr:unnamed protein product [Dibothriocephalus latus]
MNQWRSYAGLLLSRNVWQLFTEKQTRNLAKLSIRGGEKPSFTIKTEEIFSSLKDGSNVAIQGVATTPDPLIRDLCEYVHSRNLKNIHIYTTLPFGEGLFLKEPYASHFKTNFFFLGSVGRQEVNAGKANYIPMFLNEVPRFYRRRLIDLDMCIINVSAPDAHGNYSMGPSIKTILGAVEVTKCLVGIGSIPDIVLSLLHSHRDLGIHTEMFSDGIIDLCESGAVTNAHKELYQGFIVSSFILGSERVFSFVNQNSNLSKFAY